MPLELIKRGMLGRPLNSADFDENQTRIENAVNSKLDATARGAANGVASLDETGRVPLSQMRPDLRQLLWDWTTTLLKGGGHGEEGVWKCVVCGSVVPNSIGFGDPGYGACVYLLNSAFTDQEIWGSDAEIVMDFYGVIINESCQPRLLHFVKRGENGIRLVKTHPGYGDIRSEFLTGHSYPVIGFQESPVLTDRQTGELDCVDVLIGSGACSTADWSACMPVGDNVTLNVGYWDGPTWKKQLLEDLSSIAGTSRKIKLRHKMLNGRSGAGFQFRHANGSWVDGVYTPSDWASTQLAWVVDYNTDTPASNQITFNVTNSWAVLGYTSEADWLINGAVQATYKTNARRLRPIANPAVIKLLGDVWYTNDHITGRGNQLAAELTGNVHTSTNLPNTVQADKKTYFVDPLSDRLDVWSQGVEHEVVNLNSASCKNAVKMMFGLYESGGTYHIVIWSKELIHDVDWGDDGKISVVDNVKTTTDDNGNVVMAGCYGFDTGVEV